MRFTTITGSATVVPEIEENLTEVIITFILVPRMVYSHFPFFSAGSLLNRGLMLMFYSSPVEHESP